MRTKPVIFGARALLLAGALSVSALGQAAHAAPPTLLLYPRTQANQDDVRALVDLRKKLRADGLFDVLTYDPASASMIRAAGDAHHPDLLTRPMTADSDRIALTRALGAAFFAVVSKGDGRGRSDVRLVEAAPGARAWNILGEKSDDAAHSLEEQAADALQHPAQVASRAVPAGAAVVPPNPPSPSLPPRAAPVTTPAALPPVVASPPASEPVLAVPGPVATLPAPTAPVTSAPSPPAPVASAPSDVTAKASVPTASLPPVVAAVPSPQGQDPVPVVQRSAAGPAAAPPAGTEIAPSSTPIPAPARVIVPPPPPSAEDLSSIRSVMKQGDDQLAQANFVGAIALYRDAVNGAPLSTVPRLKLAQAYLAADMRDKALDEARRALVIAPGDASLQQFLMQLDAQSGTSDGAVARFDAQVSQNPQDPMAHVELGDAFWNNNTLDRAEGEYKAAQTLAGAGTPAFEAAAAHLARLYAAQTRYDDSLAALKQAGPTGYALALGIVQSRTDTLSITLDTAQEAFTAGKTTHADFYKTAADVSAQAVRLADFVIKVTPPAAFKLSHLYRVQATHLLAQQAAVVVSYIETSDPAEADKAAQLGKSAQTETLMAHAAEQKLGLWGGKQTEARN